jgi:thiol-disulfide isomerase/thioredoxin
MKYLFLQVFFLILAESCFSDDINWPNQIYSIHINDYIFERYIVTNEHLSRSELRNEYEKILDYLAEEIKIHLTNIINYHNKYFYSFKAPALINGTLAFRTIGGGHFVEDISEKRIIEIANIDLSNEINALAVAYFTVNQFIDQWNLIAGETLKERIDIQERFRALNEIREESIQANLITINRTTDTIIEVTRYNEKQPFLLRDLTNVNGDDFDLSLLKDKYVLINFITDWHPAFPREQHSLQKLYNTYGSENFEILVIFLDEKPETVKSLVEYYGYTFQTATNQDGSLRNNFSTYIPTSYLIDQDGNIILKIVNEKNWMDCNVLRMLMNNIPLVKKSTATELGRQ